MTTVGIEAVTFGSLRTRPHCHLCGNRCSQPAAYCMNAFPRIRSTTDIRADNLSGQLSFIHLKHIRLFSILVPSSLCFQSRILRMRLAIEFVHPRRERSLDELVASSAVVMDV